MKRLLNRTLAAAIMTGASMGAACGTSPPANVDGLRRVVGTDLIGARGATPADQRKIDRTVVGLCATAVWTKGECSRHGEGRE
ncbi:hypothetical protein AB395_00001541 [Sinorhizobium fredii CCBAU 45436]|nr:hypothetical protein [Sinorhizobium fredii]AWI57200.1 hypothetical protein AB395_00001541 [Sinorhizobium fredii CCBAU 45436]